MGKARSLQKSTATFTTTEALITRTVKPTCHLFLLVTRHLHQLKASLVTISFTKGQGLEALFVMAPFPPYDLVVSPLFCLFSILFCCVGPFKVSVTLHGVSMYFR